VITAVDMLTDHVRRAFKQWLASAHDPEESAFRFRTWVMLRQRLDKVQRHA
jgi:hypothetical protein